MGKTDVGGGWRPKSKGNVVHSVHSHLSPSPSTCLTLASTHLKSAAKKNGLDPLNPVFQ